MVGLRWTPALIAVLTAFLASPTATNAQEIRGTVIDGRTTGLIDGALLTLVSETGDSLTTTISKNGDFRFPWSRSGRYRLRAQRIGYALTETPLFEVPPGEQVILRVSMGVEAVPLEPLQVVTRPRVPLSPQIADFHERRKTGFGKFLTREDMEIRSGLTVRELLPSMPGVRVTHTSSGVPIVEMTRSGSNLTTQPRRLRRGAPPTVEEQFALENSCPVVLIVDGIVWAPKKTRTLDPSAISVEMDAHRQFFQISANDIEGIEAYRGLAEMPGIYASPEAQNCGVVAVWTRRARL
jgi:hypothetical protein